MACPAASTGGSHKSERSCRCRSFILTACGLPLRSQVLHTAVAVINMLELMPPLGGEDEVASDEDTLVDTVVSTTISRSTSLAAAEADRDLHLHLVYGSCRRGSRLSFQRGAAR